MKKSKSVNTTRKPCVLVSSLFSAKSAQLRFLCSGLNSLAGKSRVKSGTFIRSNNSNAQIQGQLILNAVLKSKCRYMHMHRERCLVV